MLVKYQGMGIRQCSMKDIGPAWKAYAIQEMSNYGFELFWPHDDLEVSEKTEDERVKIYENYFSLTFDLYIETKEKYNIMITPHHSSYFSTEATIPMPIPQTIQTDWWPMKLELCFLLKQTLFKKNKSFAQGMCISRSDYTIRELTEEEKCAKNEAILFLEANKSKYITRQENCKDNLYEVLANLDSRWQLPKELQKSKPHLGSRLRRI